MAAMTSRSPETKYTALLIEQARIMKHNPFSKTFERSQLSNYIPLEKALSSPFSVTFKNLPVSHKRFSAMRSNLTERVNCAGTGSGICWNLIGRLKVIGSFGLQTSGFEYSVSWFKKTDKINQQYEIFLRKDKKKRTECIQLYFLCAVIKFFFFLKNNIRFSLCVQYKVSVWCSTTQCNMRFSLLCVQYKVSVWCSTTPSVI
jgi:hypothetical protein